MKLTTWDPFREMEAVMDRYRTAPEKNTNKLEDIARSDWYPVVDVFETQAAFHIHVELPGVKKEDIKVSVSGGVLSLTGLRESRFEQNDKKIHRVERSYGSFSRRFTLPDTVDSEKVEANFQDGVLDVDMPKMEPKNNQKLDIKIG